MTLDADHCYQALLTHDARFDGAFFVGVATTGIYCRTVCTARTPRWDRCAFYPSAAAAERAGFRLCLRYRPELAPGFAPVNSVGRLAAARPEEITALGILGSRAHSLLALVRAVTAGEIALTPGGDPGATIIRLRALPGVGEWTAQYVAMRALAWPDAFPHTDLGIAKALNERNPRCVLEAAEAWRPWRAYAAMHLWKSLEQGTP